MIHPSRETLDQEIEQQTRLVRGLMAALYARIDSDPDESLLRGRSSSAVPVPGRPRGLRLRAPRRSVRALSGIRLVISCTRYGTAP